VSLVVKNYVHDLGNLFCLVGRTVNIEDWNIIREGPSVQLFQINKISVDEASGCSAVQEGLDGVELACVRGSNCYWQEQGSFSCVQGTCKGTPPFPPLTAMTTLWSYLSLFTSDT